MSEIWFYILAGFVAQPADGAPGMAYGLTASSFLVSFGIAPASAGVAGSFIVIEDDALGRCDRATLRTRPAAA